MRKVVFLKLSDLEGPQFTITTSSGTIYVTDAESIAVIAKAGKQKFSTMVSFFALEGDQQGQLKFQEEFQCQRDHDVNMTDTPIAVHVSLICDNETMINFCPLLSVFFLRLLKSTQLFSL